MLFLGKFDEDLLLLENKAVNLGNQSNQIFRNIKYDPSLPPDVIKYPIDGYNSDVWILFGDVKPTLLLKKLISSTKIIIFVFNFSKPETLFFLDEGWGPIIERIHVNNQTRILIGTRSESKSVINQTEMNSQIAKIERKLNCQKFFEEKSFQYSNFYSNTKSEFCEYIKTLLKQIKSNLQNEQDDLSSINNKRETAIYKNICYIIYKENQSAEITCSPNARGDVVIPRYVKYESQPYFINKIGPNAFESSKIKSLKFVKKSLITKIDKFAFLNSSLSILFIPASLVKLDIHWCAQARKLSQVEVDLDNKYFSIENNLLIHKKWNKIKKQFCKDIVFAQKNCLFGDLIIPNDIVHIKIFSFYKHKGIHSLTFSGNSIKSINPFSFYNCKNLKNVKFLNTSNLILDKFCFSKSANLSSIEFKCSALSIRNNCFDSCTSLNSIKFSKVKVVLFRDNVFKNCEGMTHFEMKNLLCVKFGKECFLNATKLESVVLNSGFVVFDQNCFKSCTSLSVVEIECKKKIVIPKDIFNGCDSLEKLKVSTFSKLTLAINCFYSKNLKSIEIKCKKIEIGENCFGNCCLLESVSLQSEADLIILENIFIGCSKIEKLKFFSQNNLQISNSCFKSISELNSLKLYGKSVNIDENFIKKSFPYISMKINLRKEILPFNQGYDPKSASE